MPRSLSINGPGLLHNSSNCQMKFNYYLNYMEQRKQRSILQKTYLPDNRPRNSTTERCNKRNPDTRQYTLKDWYTTKTYNLDSPLHVHQTSMFQERRTNWFITISTSLCTALVLSILCYLVYSHLRNTLYTLPTQHQIRHFWRFVGNTWTTSRKAKTRPGNTVCFSSFTMSKLTSRNLSHEPRWILTSSHQPQMLISCSPTYISRPQTPARYSGLYYLRQRNNYFCTMLCIHIVKFM